MLLRLDIMEHDTGVCLFEKVWKWSGPSHAEAICNLVRTFYQISRDIGDTGEVRQVIFEPLQVAQKDRAQSHTRNYAHNSGGPQKYIGSLKKKKTTNRDPSIRMACATNDLITIALFHELEDNLANISELVQEIQNVFGKNNADKIKKIKKNLQELVDETKQNTMTTKEVMDMFEDFQPDLDNLQKKYADNHVTLDTNESPLADDDEEKENDEESILLMQQSVELTPTTLGENAATVSIMNSDSSLHSTEVPNANLPEIADISIKLHDEEYKIDDLVTCKELQAISKIGKITHISKVENEKNCLTCLLVDVKGNELVHTTTSQTIEVDDSLQKYRPNVVAEPTSNPNMERKKRKADSNENHQAKKKREPSKPKKKKSKKESDEEGSPSKKRKKKSKDQERSKTDGKKNSALNPGAIVWAKMRSYSWWPGKVISRDEAPEGVRSLEPRAKDPCNLIFFYGSHDYAWIDRRNIRDFDKKFKEFSKTREESLWEAIGDAIEDTPNADKYRAILEDDDVMCEACKKTDNPDSMLLCDSCDYGYHTYCLTPPLDSIPEDSWFCPQCLQPHDRSDVNTSTVSTTKIQPGIAGLVNLGSTCYINSAIQCLNASEVFKQEFTTEAASPGNEMIACFQNVLLALWSGKGVAQKLLVDLKKSSGNALDFKYHSNQHQDINEYIMHLLEYIHEHLNKEAQANSKNENASTIDNANVSAASKHWSDHLAKNRSFVADAFDGMLARTRTCPAGHQSQSFETFRILPIQLPQQNKVKHVVLEDLLLDSCKEETIECRCLDCGGLQNKIFKQKTEIYYFPKYLIIQLGRFVSGMHEEKWWANKINTDVIFPLYGLDFRNICPKFGEGQLPVYDLFAVANHKGGVNGGHYWSYVKTRTESAVNDGQDSSWYNFNDNTVKPISEKNVRSSFAYMLFFKRKDCSL